MKNAKLTIKVLIVALGALALSACGKSNSSSNNGGNAIVTPGVCANCAGVQNPILLGSFVSESSRPAEFPIAITEGQIFGSGYGVASGYPVTYPGTTYPGTTGYVTNNINTYQGAVSLQGQLLVSQRIGDEVAVGSNWSTGTALPANYQGCVIEPGTYPMTTTVAGQISMGTNLNIQELAAGTIRMKLENAMVWRENNQLRVYGTLRIVSVGGRLCAPFFTSIR